MRIHVLSYQCWGMCCSVFPYICTLPTHYPKRFQWSVQTYHMLLLCCVASNIVIGKVVQIRGLSAVNECGFVWIGWMGFEYMRILMLKFRVQMLLLLSCVCYNFKSCRLFCSAHLHTNIYHSPEEKPPGGTRFGFASAAGFWLPLPMLSADTPNPPPPPPRPVGAESPAPLPFCCCCCCCWPAAGTGATAGDFLHCSTSTFGSVVFMQKFRFDEFCWSYFGRGPGAAADWAPKMSEWPPPGGFSTRLEFFAPDSPMLNSVELMMAVCCLNVCLDWSAIGVNEIARLLNGNVTNRKRKLCTQRSLWPSCCEKGSHTGLDYKRRRRPRQKPLTAQKAVKLLWTGSI